MASLHAILPRIPRSSPSKRTRSTSGAAPWCALAACLALPTVAPVPLHGQSIRGVSTESVRLTPGSRARTLTVEGTGLGRVTAVRLLRDGRPVRDVRVEIASRSGSRLSLSLSADARAAGGGEYRLELVAGRRSVLVPVDVHVDDPDPRTRLPGAARSGPAPDLIIETARLTVGPTYRQGLPIDTESGLKLVVEGRNQGEATAVFPEGVLHWKLVDGLGSATPGGDFVRYCDNDVEPGERCPSLSVEIAAPGALSEGSYELVLRIDPDDEVPESDESNNEYTLSFEVGTHRSIDTYWIWNPRPGEYGELEEAGVVDPDAAYPAPDPQSDGIVFVRGRNLDFPGLRIRLEGREAEILGRSREGGRDMIEARLDGFEGGHLEAGDGDTWVRFPGQVPRIGYGALELGALNETADALQCSVGAPVGTGTLTFLGNETDFEIPTFQQGGLSVDVVDLRSSSMIVQVEPGMDPGSEFVLATEIEFETGGREFEGEFLPEVTWWECGTLQVEASECGSPSLACFGQVLGEALTSAPSCLNLGNWVEGTGPGPAIPVAGDLTSPRLEIRTALGLAGGSLAPRRTDLAFTANVSLQTGAGAVPLGPLQTLVLGGVNAGLQEAAEDADLAGKMADHFNGLLSGLDWTPVRWLKALPDHDRVYVEFVK